jgi:hypothetical protein
MHVGVNPASNFSKELQIVEQNITHGADVAKVNYVVSITYEMLPFGSLIAPYRVSVSPQRRTTTLGRIE